jgi:flagellar basal body-associated protein FliL
LTQLYPADAQKESGLSTVVIIVIIVVVALVSIVFIACYCKRRKKAQQPEGAAEALRPEQAAPSAPSAPPQYDIEMETSPTANNEALPSYDEVVNAPNRFNFRGSSFRKLSGYFSRNNNEQKI